MTFTNYGFESELSPWVPLYTYIPFKTIIFKLGLVLRRLTKHVRNIQIPNLVPAINTF